MIIYPAIDLRGGRVVRLTEGRFDQETSYGDDPLAVARDFARSGAAWLHLVDLDGAKDPTRRQTSLVARLVQESTLQVQSGGGIRNAQQVEALLKSGVKRVIVGSVAAREPATVKQWLRQFGAERIILSPDVRIGADGFAEVAAAGWQEGTGVALHEFLADFSGAGLRHVLCTDISRDGRLSGPNVALYRSIVDQFPHLQIQASGGVSALPDLQALRETGVAGAIVGRALYEKRFTLEEALTV